MEFEAFIEVFRHHHTESDKKSGSMPAHSSLNNRSVLISIASHYTALLLPLLSVFHRLVRPQGRSSETHPHQLFLIFLPGNLVSSSSSPIENLADLLL